MSADVTLGKSYTVDVDLGSCHPSVHFSDGAKIFIDWNIDGDFLDNGEEVAKFGTVKFTECVEGLCDIPIIATSSPLSKKSPSIFQSINIFAPSEK
jgi:hypothetical protein